MFIRSKAVPDPRDVFINCPFDAEYWPFFRIAIFTILRCGFTPRSAIEIQDSAAIRIHKIVDLIGQCPLAIHDISRTELSSDTGLPRFNMPLELGLFLGAHYFGDATQQKKRCLILDREKHRYHKFISDIGGQDIQSHGGTEPGMVKQIRDFLNHQTGNQRPLPMRPVILADYAEFQARLPEICAEADLDHTDLEYPDFCWLVGIFLDLKEKARPS